MTSDADPKYPATPRIPVAQHLPGLTFDDPYVWLEENTPEVLAWQRAQSEVARGYIRSWPGYPRLREEVGELCARAYAFAPHHRGGRWIQQRRGRAGSVLTVADSPDGPYRVLVDPAAVLPQARHPELDWYHPSPHGRYVAVGLSADGTENSTIHVVETGTGRIRGARLPYALDSEVAWLPDETGFYYTAKVGGVAREHRFGLFFHAVDDRAQRAPEPVYGLPQVSTDGRWVLAHARPTKHLKELPDGSWRPWLTADDGVSAPGNDVLGVFVGASYIAITTEKAPRGRLVEIPVATAGDRSTWREIRPEGHTVLRTVERVGDHLVLCVFDDAFARLQVLRRDGGLDHEIELPGRGTVRTQSLISHYQLTGEPHGGQNIYPGDGGFTFVFSTLTRAPRAYHYDLRGCRLTALGPPTDTPDTPDTQVKYLCAPSTGAQVRYRLVHRADADLSDGPRPVLVFGYGGGNISFIPAYLGCLLSFVRAGGMVAFAHLRGGVEFGVDQWLDGFHATKQHTFDDVIAVAEDLVDRHWASPRTLALVGGSNGGLMTGTATTQRPDLWRAAAALVGVFDMLRIAEHAYGEFGSPHDDGLRWLSGYSPYHHTGPASYPATLVLAGANDRYAPVWHSRKFAARRQRENTGEHPQLLLVVEDFGHTGTMSDPDVATDWLAFLMRELDMREPDPREADMREPDMREADPREPDPREPGPRP